MRSKLSAQERKWRAREDARTLAESELIKSDPVRLREAKREAARIAAEEEQKVNAMKAIISKGEKPKKKKASKTPKKKKSASNPHNVFARLGKQ